MQEILNFDKHGIKYHVFQFNSDSYGTIKDIGAYETIEHALSQGANVIVNVTSGNNGEALRRAVFKYNKNKPLEERVKVVHIISPNPKVEEGLRGYSEEENFAYSTPIVFNELNKKWLTSQDRTSIAKECLKEGGDNFKVKGIVDVTHTIPNGCIGQAEQILSSNVNDKYLDYIAIPVGTGKTFVAFYNALTNLKNKGIKINTKLIGFVPKGENPIYHNFVTGRGLYATPSWEIEAMKREKIFRKLKVAVTSLIVASLTGYGIYSYDFKQYQLDSKKYYVIFETIGGDNLMVDALRDINAKHNYELGLRYDRYNTTQLNEVLLKYLGLYKKRQKELGMPIITTKETTEKINAINSLLEEDRKHRESK